jgi:hypothetical protein
MDQKDWLRFFLKASQMVEEKWEQQTEVTGRFVE